MRILPPYASLRVTAIALALALCPHLISCSGKNIDEKDPTELTTEAERDIKNDRYQLAIDKLRMVKNKYPYSKQAIGAQLRLADVFFMQESYAEAAMAYQAFVDLHPKHEQVSYAQFRVGLSHFNDSPDLVARDQTPTTRALEAFEVYLKRFPAGPEAGEAREKANQARAKLAAKELYIGNFYSKRDEWSSAKTRYKKIIQLYPETESAKEAKIKLDEEPKQQ